MRIECENCGAKYSVADEKVIGKLFKVRCKKCSHMIMVDGTSMGGGEETDEATRVFDVQAAQHGAEESMTEDGGGVWYVVLDGAQTGPMTVNEVRAQIDAGAVDQETFAWREGMDDWLRLADIGELAGLIGTIDDEDFDDEYDDEATRVVSTDSPDAGGFSFGAAVSQSSAESIESFPSGSYSAAARTEAPQVASPADAQRDFFATASAPAEAPAPAASEPKMEGQRNESSVLFSLAELTAKNKPKKQEDLPRTEGSGLIDIRVLANANNQVGAGGGDSGGASAPGAAAAVPMTPLVPVPARRSNTGMMIGIGAGVIVILALVAVLFVVLNAEDEEEETADEPDNTEMAANDSEEDDDTDEQTEDDSQEEEVEVAANTPDTEGSGAVAEGSGATAEGSGAVAEGEEGEEGEESSNDEDEDDDDEEERVASSSSSSSSNSSSSSRDDENEEEEEEEETPSRDSGRSIDDIIGSSSGGDEEESSSANAGLPDTLSRSDIQRSIRRYRRNMDSCAGGESGEWDFRFIIQPNGSVTSAQARASDDVSNCILGVIRDMSFDRFSGDPIRQTYQHTVR